MSNVQYAPFDNVSVGDKVRVVREYRNDTSVRDGQTATVITKHSEHKLYPYQVQFEDGEIDMVHSVRKEEQDPIVSAAQVTGALRKYAQTSDLSVDQTVDLMLTLAELGLYEKEEKNV